MIKYLQLESAFEEVSRRFAGDNIGQVGRVLGQEREGLDRVDDLQDVVERPVEGKIEKAWMMRLIST